MPRAASFVSAIAAIAGSAVILSACAGNAPQIIVQTRVVPQTVTRVQTEVVEVPVTATPALPTPIPTRQPARPADTLVLAVQEPDTMDPLIDSSPARRVIYSTIAPGCLGQDEHEDWVALGCETVPTLANGGAVMAGSGADQHLEITYKIRKGWRWTDGTPVTAADAVYWWKDYMDPDLPVADRSEVEKVYQVQAVDPATIQVDWLSENQAKAAAAGTLTGTVPFDQYQQDYIDGGYDQQAGPVVDPTYWANIGWLPSAVWGKIPAQDQAASEVTSRLVMGDGAYVIKAWLPGQELDLVKSDQPFPLGTPQITNIVYRFFSDPDAIISALAQGKIDAVTSASPLSAADAPALDRLQAAGDYEVNWRAGYAWEHIDLNTSKPPLDDVKVRQALAYATDARALADQLYFGVQPAGGLPVPEDSWAYTGQYTRYNFDPARAKQILADDGWDCRTLPCIKAVAQNGQQITSTQQVTGTQPVTQTLELTLQTTEGADREALAEKIQAEWQAINVGVNLEFRYGRELFAPCSAGGPLQCRTFDAAIYTWVLGDDAIFGPLYECQAIPTSDNGWIGQNYPGFCDKDADAALQKSELDATVAPFQDKRKPYIQQFFQIWTAQAPAIPLFANAVPYVSRVGFAGWKPGPTLYAEDGWNAWEWTLSK